MSKRKSLDVVKRYEGNPILSAEDIPFPCNTVFNAGAVKFDGEYLLLLRVEDLRGHSVLALACSEDGYNFTVHDEPVMVPATEGQFAIYERKGIEDPRITKIDDTFYIIYTAVSDFGARLALAKTEDFRSFERVALISEPENKDGALFPRKIAGQYVRMDRPVAGGVGNIWVSYSDDLVSWRNSRVLMTVRSDCWDSWRIGASAPPIETEYGWLVIYHGVRETSHGPIYRLGAAMLDADDPTKILCRSAIPILAPREDYERTGDIPNVVYSTGAIMEDDGTLTIYYSGADTCICVGTVRLEQLMQFCTIGEKK
ncbi:MAG TPA: glycosidase [Phycisphaerae bacterium]|nr:glycosidase [Phycisphaerae bacterium]